MIHPDINTKYPVEQYSPPPIPRNEPPRNRTRGVNRLLMRAAEMYGTTTRDLQSKAKKTTICEARYAVIVALKHLGYNWSSIGRALGNRNHSTIIHGYARGIGLTSTQIGFTDIINELIDSVETNGGAL